MLPLLCYSGHIVYHKAMIDAPLPPLVNSTEQCLLETLFCAHGMLINVRLKNDIKYAN